MGKIRQLPEGLVNKIAAGEVVERPASVLKELLENSLDAGAHAIEVDVKEGGRKLMRVADDGCGMDREDAVLALDRHATSKLRTEDDLFRITTMGFRGEALPAIASVARMRIETAPRGAVSGTAIEVEGGRVTDVRDAPARGTVMEVRDLFFNTPARAKFLKRTATELYHAMDGVTRLALAHPEVAFRVRVEGEETMVLGRARGHRERLAQVYGVEFLEGLVEAAAQAGGMSLSAFVSRPGNMRETRANQMVFLNGRAVRDATVSHAVTAGCEGRVPEGKHPIFFVFLSVDPKDVDVNVHPTKREVRFADKEGVHRFVRRAVADALAGAVAGGAAGSCPPEHAASGLARPGVCPSPGSYPMPGSYPTPGAYSTPMGVADSQGLGLAHEFPFVYAGDTYIALSTGDGLMLLDHHAAHERVLYERFLGGVGLAGRRLLFPRQVKLSPVEHAAIVGNADMLGAMGIEIEDFGHDTVIVRTLPEEMEEAGLRGVLADAAAALAQGEAPGRTIREAVAARIACHGSVRGRQVLTRESVAALLRDLDRTARPEECPHGRPTRLRLTLDDLARMFKRK